MTPQRVCWRDDEQLRTLREELLACGLRVRFYNAVRRTGYQTVGDVRAASDEKLLQERNVGPSTVAAWRAVLARFDPEESTR